MAITASTMLKALTFGLIIALVICAEPSDHSSDHRQPNSNSNSNDRFRFGMGLAVPFSFSGVIPNQGYGGYPGIQSGFGYPGGFPFPSGYSPYPFQGGYGQYPGGFGGYPYGGFGGFPNGPMGFGPGVTYLSSHPSNHRPPHRR